MIKGIWHPGAGKTILYLGLSGETVTRLAAGEPVMIDAATLRAMGITAEAGIVIDYGRTEQAILDRLAQNGITLDGT